MPVAEAESAGAEEELGSVNSPFSDHHLSIEELRRGIGLPSLMVIDDFLLQPDAVRREALRLTSIE